MSGIEQQVALVTGGAGGIGLGIVKCLLAGGAEVIIADIDLERAQAVASELGAGCHAIALDVTRRDQVAALYRRIEQEFGRLDILCSNTGIFPQARLESMTDEDWHRVQEVNVTGLFLMVQGALPMMRRQRYGRIVITSSITGPVTGFPGWAHYGASKAAQLGFMRSAALEVARDGITINAVMPGNILTEGLKAQGQAYLDAMAASVPAGMLGEPADIGHAVRFLASREARYITGQTLIVDGGQILPESPDAIP